MDDLKNILLIVVLIAFLYYRYKIQVKASAFKKMLLHNIKMTLRESGHFSNYQILYGDIKHGDIAAIAVDNISQKTALIYFVNKEDPGALSSTFYSPNEIVSVEILEDKAAIMTTNRMSQAGGFVVGGLLSPAGAVIGALTGKKTTNEIVNNIDLKLVVENLREPVIIFPFFNGKVKKGTSEYKKVIQGPQHWHAKFSTLIHIGKK
ncbi:hypothetical protein [Pelosinus sp. sgz500959]|uniref:hypothetical protein n=1 Tax=Pelosinus sp. sgz500959 TaxID=3242472 RepID=UPI00366E4BC4